MRLLCKIDLESRREDVNLDLVDAAHHRVSRTTAVHQHGTHYVVVVGKETSVTPQPTSSPHPPHTHFVYFARMFSSDSSLPGGYFLRTILVIS